MQNKKLLQGIAVILCALMLAMPFSACAGTNGGSETDGSAQLVTIDMDCLEATLEKGETLQLTATASDGTKLSWISSEDGVASVTQEGLVTALSVGTTNVVASCARAMAKCVLTVVEKEQTSEPEQTPDPEPTPDPKPDPTPELQKKLVWSDEFDGTSLDTTKWEYQLGRRDIYHGVDSNNWDWGNNEQQYYTKDAVSVQNGNLKITATKRSYEGKNYTSGRIATRDRASFTYGYFEAKMMTPAITGMWPAFWMLPQPLNTTSTNNQYGGWASSGEIDIMEAKGRLQNKVDTTLHYGGYWPNQRHSGATTTLSTSTEYWHTYALEWRENKMIWYIDGSAVFSLTSKTWYSVESDKEGAPFDVPFYLLFDLAVGGNYDGNVLPPDTFTSASMYVDYVRVYQYL